MSNIPTRPAHTPGPWQVVYGDSTTLYIDDQFGLEGGRDYYLAELRHGDEGELCANARLMAAAPKLLAALRACLPILIEHGRQSSKTTEALVASTSAIGCALYADDFDPANLAVIDDGEFRYPVPISETRQPSALMTAVEYEHWSCSTTPIGPQAGTPECIELCDLLVAAGAPMFRITLTE